MHGSRDDQQNLLRMEGILSGLLRYGAIVASVWLAFGMVLGALTDVVPALEISADVSHGCLAIGIVLLIALPVLRVAIMMTIFLLEKDFRFAAISGAVLIIIALGFLLGTLNSHIDFL